MDKIAARRNAPLCAGLDDAELAAVARISRPASLAKSELLFQEGDPAEGFYVLLEGLVRVFKASPEGREYTLHVIRPGQMFAEVAMFAGKRYPANCTALEDSRVAFFPKGAFLRLMGEHPEISLKIIASLAHFVREFNRMVEELSLREVPARVAGFLAEEARRQGGPSVVLDTTKAELASRLGTISATLSRTFGRMKDERLIRVDGRTITILNPARLQEIAEGLERL